EPCGDHRAVSALAADDRARLGFHVEESLRQSAVDPVCEALAVPGLRRVTLEDAPVLARVAGVLLDPRDLRVDVVVQQARVGDDVELWSGAEVITGEDHVRLLDAGRAVERSRD